MKKCLETVFELAKNKKIVFIGSDLGQGPNDFKKNIQKDFLWRV